VVTYDEHGGLFDHVTPPEAVSPFSTPVDNFSYDRYGVRVPTLLVNPYVRQGQYPMSLDPPMPLYDHTSLLATLKSQFALSGSLSPRVDSAIELQGLIQPGRQPIPPPSIPVPQCTWTPPADPGHAEPILRSLLWRGTLPV
jgi:phospholipase C